MNWWEPSGEGCPYCYFDRKVPFKRNKRKYR